MPSLKQSLLNAERLDLAAALACCADELPFLARLADLPHGERSVLAHTQSVMDALLDQPPPVPPAAAESAVTPWWSAMPAAYVAALFQHAGLPEVCAGQAAPVRLLTPHARESVRLAREVLRAWGVPFTVREHAAALILNQRRLAGLVGSGAADETYMRLSCSLDLRSLYCLLRAEVRAAGAASASDGLATALRRGARQALRLEAFRERAERAGVFGRPYGAPLSAERVADLGFAEPRERHRALNALRYFALVARMNEGQWFVERLRQERERPRGRLHLLVGPAGCGKSTWARQHLSSTTFVSSDGMREELTGDPADQSQNYLVFQRCMDRIRERLHEGSEVTFDATNYSEALRSMPVQAARWAGAEIVSYFFDVGLSTVLARSAARARVVPEDVIRKQHRLIEPPALYEADRHMVVDEQGDGALYWPAEGV
jgi:predicted kinase